MSQTWDHRTGLLLLACLLFPASLRAEVSLSFPLRGYYRPGNYMPVEVMPSGPSIGTLSINGNGIVPVDYPLAGAREAVVPLLILTPPNALSWTTASDAPHSIDLTFHPLSEDEVLIGYAGADVDVLKPLFSGKKLIGIPLDLLEPLQGSPASWETLGGVVLDAATAGRIDQSQLAGLLATGMVIAVRSNDRPSGPFHWQQSGAFWIVQFPITGPTSAFVPTAYEPIAGWSRGWPRAFRIQILWAALLFGILVVAATLWRSRWAAIVIVAICAATVAVTISWSQSQSATLETGGSILVLSESGAQQDTWTYRAVMRAADDSFACEGLTHPIFATRRQIAQMPVRLVCRANGEIARFDYHLDPGRALAFMERSIAPSRPAITPTQPVSSPLRLMAQSLYLNVNERIAGQEVQEGEERWPAVVIGK